MQVAVAGSTGHIGKVLTKQLAQLDDVQSVKAFSRKGNLWQHSKIEALAVNYESAQAVNDALLQQEVVFCCLGTTMKRAGSKEAFRKVDFDYVNHLIKASENLGVRQFHLISAMGASTSSMFYYSKIKGKIEEVLKHANIPVKYIYRPGLLGGKREENRFGEKMAQRFSDFIQPLMIGPFFKYRQVMPETLAHCMIQHALKAEKGTHCIEADVILRAT